jgi:hypothetical protein
MIKEEIKNKILNTIQKVTGVDITTKTRKYEFIEARMIYYKLLRDRGYSLQEIGDTLDKNHATVLHGINVFNDIKDYDKDLMEKYSAAIQLLAGEKISKYVTTEELTVGFGNWLLMLGKELPVTLEVYQQFKKEAGYECA